MIEYIVIAILQGLFEWLPISSSGQVMIISINLFNISPSNAFSLAIWLHLGTTLSVLLKFGKDFYKIGLSLLPKNSTNANDDKIKRNWIIVATMGTVITAIPLYFILKLFLDNIFTASQGDIITLIIAGFLIITGILLLKSNKLSGEKVVNDLNDKFLQKDGLITGLVQGFSILPGISRSGVTITSLLFENYDQEEALKLSFLISVPAALGSIAVDIIFGEGSVFGNIDILTIIISTLMSFIVGYLTIETLLRIAKRINFSYFCIFYGVLAFLIISPFLFIN